VIAKQLMTREVITVSPAMTVKKLATTLIKNQISGAPVTSANGNIVGVVSEADIVAKKGNDVASIMSRKVVTIGEDTTVAEIARLMTRHKIKRLPVMNGAAVIGIVSRADIVGAMASGKLRAVRSMTRSLGKNRR